MRMKGQCRKYRELIPLLIDGELDEATAARVEHHLNHCKGCMNEFKWQKWLCSVLRSMPYIPAPPDFTERTLERIRQLQAQKGATAHLSGIFGHPLLQFVRAPAYAFILIIAFYAGWMAFKMTISNTNNPHPTRVTMADLTPLHVEEPPIGSPQNHIQIAAAKPKEALAASTHVHRGSNANSTRYGGKGLITHRVYCPMVKPTLSGNTVTIARSDVNAIGSASEMALSVSSLRTLPTAIAAEPKSVTPTISAGALSEELLSLPLTDVKQFTSAGKLSHAVERLTELIRKTAVGEPTRYRALCLLKMSYERMGEWLLAKSVAEQIASELKTLNDVRLIAWVAQVCESDGDSQLANELYAAIAEHSTYPTSLRAYAQTRLASLRSRMPNQSVAMNANETPQAQNAPPSVPEGQQTQPEWSSGEGGEHKANGDVNLIEDLLKLAEAI